MMGSRLGHDVGKMAGVTTCRSSRRIETAGLAVGGPVRACVWVHGASTGTAPSPNPLPQGEEALATVGRCRRELGIVEMAPAMRET